jgi:hypothetical protein
MLCTDRATSPAKPCAAGGHYILRAAAEKAPEDQLTFLENNDNGVNVINIIVLNINSALPY